MLLIALCLLCKDTKFFVEIQIIMEEFFNYLLILTIGLTGKRWHRKMVGCLVECLVGCLV